MTLVLSGDKTTDLQAMCELGEGLASALAMLPPGVYIERRKELAEIFRSCSGAFGDQLRGILGLGIAALEVNFQRDDDDNSRRLLSEIFRVPDVRRAIEEKYDFDSSQLDMNTLEFHQFGTTSVIVTVDERSNFSQPKKIALKLVQAPYNSYSDITEATEHYKEIVGPLSQALRDSRGHVAEPLSSGANWVMMEYVEGEPLDNFLLSLRGWESYDRSSSYGRSCYLRYRLKIAQLLIEGLGDILAMAEQLPVPIQHRDLNPKNVIIARLPQGPQCELSLKLTVVDFGENYLVTQRLGSTMDIRVAAQYVAPELQQPPHSRDKIDLSKSDYYSVGLLLLDTLYSPQRTESRLERLLELFELSPMLAACIDDLTAESPALRLALTGPADQAEETGIANHVFAEIGQALDLSARFGAIDGDLTSHVGWLNNLSIPARKNFKQVWKLLRVALSERGTSRELSGPGHFASYLTIWACICMAAYIVGLGASIVYTLHDFGVSAGPAYWSFPFSYRIASHSKWTNLSGRLVGASFTIVAARYYLNIFSGLTTRGVSWRGSRLMEFSMRLNSFAFAVPVLLTITFEPLWWPYCSAAGTGIVAINNYICARAMHVGLNTEATIDGITRPTSEWIEGGRTLQRFVSRDDYYQWASLMATYSAFLFIVGVLLSFHLILDAWFYAVLSAVGVNYLKLYRSNAEKLAPRVRGPANRTIYLLRRVQVASAKSVQRSTKSTRYS